MSGKGSVIGSYQGLGGQGYWGGRGRGIASRGYSYSVATHKYKGLCSAIGIHVFDYNHKASSDQMRTIW